MYKFIAHTPSAMYTLYSSQFSQYFVTFIFNPIEKNTALMLRGFDIIDFTAELIKVHIKQDGTQKQRP